MSRDFQQAGSLLSIVKHSKHKDCAHLFKHLREKGTELFCELLYFIVNGYLELKPTSHAKLKTKIKKCIKEIKTLITRGGCSMPQPKRFGESSIGCGRFQL